MNINSIVTGLYFSSLRRDNILCIVEFLDAPDRCRNREEEKAEKERERERAAKKDRENGGGSQSAVILQVRARITRTDLHKERQRNGVCTTNSFT